MNGSPVTVEFEKLVRPYLPLLDDEAVLAPDTMLTDLGLDSLATVGLLMDLEEAFGVQFPDELLTGETFATAASLWGVVVTLRGKAA